MQSAIITVLHYGRLISPHQKIKFIVAITHFIKLIIALSEFSQLTEHDMELFTLIFYLELTRS